MKLPKAGMIGVAALLALGLIATACSSGPSERSGASERPAPEASGDAEEAAIDPVAFNDDLRRLWEDHIVWTRMFIVSAAADLPDTDAAAERLLRNQDDIGDAVAQFYGEEAGEELAALLRDHILIAADLVGAAKAGQQGKVQKASERWYANADEIAAFLAAANPNWPQGHMAEMMRTHLDVTLEEATARLGGDWEADIAAYDQIHEDILAMADGLADGIVAQFPERFGEPSLSEPAAELRLALRRLWEDHIVWTRMFIVSAAADLPDTDAAAERLLRNQDDIGDAVAQFYGEEAGEELAALLRDHILIAADLVGAAKAGQQGKVQKASERWYANADEIAAFLAAANPNWPQGHMAEMMRTHLDVTLEEATARLGGDWEADIAAYDQIHEDILAMADGLADGIVAQFPERF